MPNPVLAVNERMQAEFVNDAAETFFDASRAVLMRNKLATFVSFGSPLLALIQQVMENGTSVNEYGVELASPRFGERGVDIQVSPIVDTPGHVLVILQERTMAHKMDRQLTHRGAARSVGGSRA